MVVMEVIQWLGEVVSLDLEAIGSLVLESWLLHDIVFCKKNVVLK